MELLILALFCIILVVAFVVGYKLFNTSACYVMGIGGVVSANVYNIGNYNIVVGGLTFGVDSIIYTIAIFCIAVILADYGKKAALTLTYTYIASIFLTAVTDFIVKWVTVGFGADIVWGLYSYMASIVATFIAIFVCLQIFKVTLLCFLNIVFLKQITIGMIGTLFALA